MALTTLYHGTDIESAKIICNGIGIDLRRCNIKTDFGKGFYTTDSYERATKWGFTMGKIHN